MNHLCGQCGWIHVCPRMYVCIFTTSAQGKGTHLRELFIAMNESCLIDKCYDMGINEKHNGKISTRWNIN